MNKKLIESSEMVSMVRGCLKERARYSEQNFHNIRKKTIGKNMILCQSVKKEIKTRNIK